MVNAEHQYNVTYVETCGGWAGHKVTAQNVDWYHLCVDALGNIVYRKPSGLCVPVLDIEECKPVTLADVQRSNAGWTYND